MSYSILPTHKFESEIKRLLKKFPSLKEEYAQLIKEIIENPELGTALGNNCYKIRVAIKSKGKGKSGGARAITYFYLDMETVYLLTIYDKSEKENLTPSELKIMIDNLDLE
jgi:hypothetical protein